MGHSDSVRSRGTATGYLAIARRFGGDRKGEHHLTLEDTIDNLGRAFLGSSISCARCHDHKFDPFTMSDDYGLYGIFESTRYPFPGAEADKKPADFVPLMTPAEIDARDLHEVWCPVEVELSEPQGARRGFCYCSEPAASALSLTQFSTEDERDDDDRQPN